MIVIGITGPTGAGKTTALDVLAEMGFEIVDCDALYYRLLQTDEGLRQGLRDAFGEVFLPDGSLDRRAVAKRVFGDQEELAKLNGVVFPAVSAAVEQKIQKCSQKGLAIDAINLVESGMGGLCDATVAVTASPAIRLKRIMARDGLTEEQARARIKAQKPADWYRDNCSFLLENQEEDREAFEALMRSFFRDLLEIINKRRDL
ncbi:MAG: dephospho-CoA kinase [Oscillospiraceae bacterium]|nr:dephospho-CoA kinase [Oscillospiraceae bacterium]